MELSSRTTCDNSYCRMKRTQISDLGKGNETRRSCTVHSVIRVTTILKIYLGEEALELRASALRSGPFKVTALRIAKTLCGRQAPSVDGGGCSRGDTCLSCGASARVEKTSTFRHSSRNLPLKLSTYPSSINCLDRMKADARRWCRA